MKDKQKFDEETVYVKSWGQERNGTAREWLALSW